MNYFAHATAVIDNNVNIGNGTKIWHFTHICSNATIGQNCNIGQNVFIAPNVTIGNNVKIQNGVSVYEGVHIEDWCFLGPHCVFTNDKYPRSFGDWKKTNTYLKRGCSIGANATILCGVTIGEQAMVGAGTVVIKDVEECSLVVGNPARKIKNFNKVCI